MNRMVSVISIVYGSLGKGQVWMLFLGCFQSFAKHVSYRSHTATNIVFPSLLICLMD